MLKTDVIEQGRHEIIPADQGGTDHSCRDETGVAEDRRTRIEVSYMFRGKVPLPLPQIPWWPQL